MAEGITPQIPNEKLSGEVIYRDAEIEVIRGATEVIIPEADVVCSEAFVFRYNNGDILVCTPQNRGKGLYKRSTDGGQNWVDSPIRTAYEGGAAYQYPEPDDEVISLPGSQIKDSDAIKKGRKSADLWEYETVLSRSNDNGLTQTQEKATIRVPQVERLVFDHSMVGFSDGSLLAAGAARFTEEGDIKERTIVCRSTDRGITWNYRASVAVGNDESCPGLEGFCEPDMLVLPDGNILCFMRTGGGSGFPVCMSKSKDNGITWAKTRIIADWGVWPNAVLLENEVIALFTGRPGNWIQFSVNRGKNWVSWYEVDSAPSAHDCTHYNGLEQVAPNSLLAVYCRGIGDAGAVELVGTYFTVVHK